MTTTQGNMTGRRTRSTTKSPKRRADVVMLKIQSLHSRANLLSGLRQKIALPAASDISTDQWLSLELQLATATNNLRRKLKAYVDKYYYERDNIRNRQKLIHLLGVLEMEMTNAYNFYDTFMDILAQRRSKNTGMLLKGCDILALHAMRRGNLAELTVAPVVYCDRGFGASILREGVNVTKGIPNPVPFIAIPYSRISEKYNLISIFHEAGHQALVKLNMVDTWKDVIRQSLLRAGSPAYIADLFANWSRELIPDFWAFCLCGMAQTCSIRDVLVLPHHMMFTVSPVQPHPPSYLRFLVSVAWCRHIWGQGLWDTWEREWIELYPLDNLDNVTKQTMITCRKYLPDLAKAIITTRFRKFGNKPLTALFDMQVIAPDRLIAWADISKVNEPGFLALPAGVQLAAFRMMRESPAVKASELDRKMEAWLYSLININN